MATLLARHPVIASTVVTGATIWVFPAMAVAPALYGLGFGSPGVVLGSIASVAQSYIGNVALGSAFACLQSAGAGGYGLAVLHGAAQAGGATLTAAGGSAAIFKLVKKGSSN